MHHGSLCICVVTNQRIFAIHLSDMTLSKQFFRPPSRTSILASPPPPPPPPHQSMRFYKREFQRLKDRPSDGNLSNEIINETGNSTNEQQSSNKKTLGRLSSFLRRDFHMEKDLALVGV